MNRKFKSLKGVQLRNEGEPQIIPFQPGMNLVNANGDVDSASAGYQYTIQTTTQIRARVIEQKYYLVPPADFIPVQVGTGAWMEDIKTNLTYDVAGPFERGLINTSVGHAQVPTVDVATAPKTTKIATWAMGYQYTLPELKKALAANNWDVVSSKLSALKKRWDLGIQEVAFLGLLTDLTGFPGLLTQSEVNANTSLITENISSMDTTEFNALVAGILAAYGANCDYTAMPTDFAIPMDDYLGLAAPVSPSFPLNTKLQYLLETFKTMTQNPNFQIRPLAYGVAARNAGYVSAGGKNRYVLYNRNPDTLWMDIPVEMFLSPAGTSNNFHWQGVGAGQFAGVTVARPKEVLYFDHS